MVAHENLNGEDRMKLLATALVALAVALPSVAWSQTETETEAETGESASGPVRPDDEDGKKKPSDGLAECAAILAVASTTATNLIDRNSMQNASGAWFAASGDLAIEEGKEPKTENWENKVASWAGQIGSVDAMSTHGDWMSYCAAVGAQYGLETTHFASRVPPPEAEN